VALQKTLELISKGTTKGSVTGFIGSTGSGKSTLLDIVMGLLYMGYTDEPTKQGKRNIPLESKTIWKG
jgi:ABC-type multidrug transport system ATPase subunit